MSRLLSTALVLVTVLLSPRPSWADSILLSHEQALQIARERSPATLRAQGLVEEARGPVVGAARLFQDNPTFSAAAGPRATPSGSDGLNLELGLSQTLEIGPIRGARRNSANAALAVAERELQRAERTLLGDVSKAFAQALYERDSLQVAKAGVEATAELARIAGRRFEAGEVAVVEVNVARLAGLRSEAAARAAEGRLNAAKCALALLLALEPSGFELDGSLGALASAGVKSQESHPVDLQVLEAELELARQDVQLADAVLWPQVTLGLGYEREGDEHAAVGTLSLPLPVFERGQAQRISSTARLDRLASAVEAARQLQKQQFVGARAVYEANLEAVQLLEREALPLVQENLALSTRAYEVGEMGLPDLLVIRREALEARADHLDRLLVAALSRVDLLVLTGAFP